MQPRYITLHLLLDENSSRRGSGAAIGGGVLSVTGPNLPACKRIFAIFVSRGAHEPALRNFHAAEMAV
ncbi:MAG: hypothetical protein ACREDJ_01490 [Methylocella sp.]